jgi:soluble lytic murein transglycosylase
MQGRLYLRMEADAEFLQIASQVAEAFPGSKQADEISYLTGHFYRNRGRVPEAMHAFQQVVDRGKASAYADDAWWYVGWLYYGSGEYDRAAHTWGKLLTAFPSSGLAPDTLYWQGRALERAERQSEARTRYERLRTSYRQTFYGHLATARLEGRAVWAWEANQRDGWPGTGEPPPNLEALPTAEVDPHVVRGRELWAMHLFASAGAEFQAVSTPSDGSRFWQARAAQAFHWAGEHYRAMRLVRRYGKANASNSLGLPGPELREMLYPLGALERLPTSDFDGLDPLVVSALIMAESDWNPRAFSPVGARGLMQLMPDTGRRMAQMLGTTVSSDEALFDPTFNLKLGVAYLGTLSRRFGGKMPLVLASYNAGEDQVSLWWSKRTGDDLEEFIANIPFRETRRYVQRVYTYYAEYQRIYRDAPG